jgi:addiction module RelE/StbE family toxin
VKLVLTKEALDRLEEIEIFIARDNPRRAEEFVNHLISRAEIILQNPSIGRIVPEISNPDIREIIVKKYRIVYRIKKKIVEILTVFEGHRLLIPDEINLESE